MIIVKIQGGLGNQMFQYAFGRRVAEDRKDELKLDLKAYTSEPFDALANLRTPLTIRNFGLDDFNITAHGATPEEASKHRNPFGALSKAYRLFDERFHEFYTGYYPNLLKSKRKYFDGFFKNEKYFTPIEGIIRKEFTLKEPLGELASQIKDAIASSQNPVSFHIRRGDYASNQNHTAFFGLMPVEYYKKAESLMKEKVGAFTPFVFSDDIEWVKKNIPFEGTPAYVSQPGLKICEELMLMSYCKHNVTANSSFSWWGAWLNQNKEKVVIAPEKWLAKTNSDYYKEIPESWIKI